MIKHNRSIQATPVKENAYIEYMSKFKELQHIPHQLPELADGIVLLEFVLLIKDFRIYGEIQINPRTFSHKFHNFKVLLRSIEQFWITKLDKEIQGDQIDLIEITKSNNNVELQKCLELLIKTAMQAENKSFFIEKVLETTSSTQLFLKRIIEKVIGIQAKQSPRKQKQKRMYDKILQLDHENQKLQQTIYIICDQKAQLQQKLANISSKLQQKTNQLQKIQYFVSDSMCTPQKRRNLNIPDTNQRKDNHIEALKKQMNEMKANYERQIRYLTSQNQKMAFKAQNYDNIKNELNLCKSIIESNKELIAQANNLERMIHQLRQQSEIKSKTIFEFENKLEKVSQQLQDSKESQNSLQQQIHSCKNIISELNYKLQNSQKAFSPIKRTSNNLYEQFPDIGRIQTNALMQTNKSLREQIQRTRKRYQKSQGELSTTLLKLQQMKKHQIQNIKLRQLIIQQKSYKGQQIDVLVSSLYFLRKTIREKQSKKLKQKN